MKRNSWMTNIVSVVALLLLLIAFSVMTKGRIFTVYNLISIVEQTLLTIIGGAGAIFVISQGNMDMSQGSTLALGATLGIFAAVNWGIVWYIPVALISGLLVGLFNGIVVSKFKVSSFMVTIAMLIALRAFVQLLLTEISVVAPLEIRLLNKMEVKLPVFLGLIIILSYLFERTYIGRYCKAIGENEKVVKNSGINVDKIKLLAFILSAIMAAIVGVFMLSRIGGTNMTMGNMFELRVMMALFVGGVPISGGMNTKMYKLICGALSIGILENGLTLMGVSSSIYEMIEGIILLGVIAITRYLNSLSLRSDQEKIE